MTQAVDGHTLGSISPATARCRSIQLTAASVPDSCRKPPPLPFGPGEHGRPPVSLIDDHGIASLKVTGLAE